MTQTPPTANFLHPPPDLGNRRNLVDFRTWIYYILHGFRGYTGTPIWTIKEMRYAER